MERHARSKLNTQIYEEACEWFVGCRAGDLDDNARRELDRWLRKSPEHLSAYLEIAAIWDEGQLLDPKNQWDTQKLISQAAEDRGNVIAIPGAALGDSSANASDSKAPPDQSQHEPAGKRTARRGRLLALAAAVCGVGVGALFLTQTFRAPAYETAVGEQRSIVLADGSTVELNSRSRVKVRYSEHERAVELLEGQALFHVAKEHARPFVVSSGATRVRAVGTQFDVYKKHGGTVVTVVEGRVAVLTQVAAERPDAVAAGPQPSTQSSSSGTGILLSAGEQLSVTPTTVHRVANPSIAGATAWKQRQLVFESASLAEVAEEFNRYNERQLVIEDGELYDFHISGVFSSTDPSSLIRFLRERRGLRVIETATEIRVEKNSSQRG